jgi:hypothetical protein
MRGYFGLIFAAASKLMVTSSPMVMLLPPMAKSLRLILKLPLKVLSAVSKGYINQFGFSFYGDVKLACKVVAASF